MGDRRHPTAPPKNQRKPAPPPAPPRNDGPRPAFNALADELGRYLESIGWRALVVGSPAIEGVEVDGLGRYRFVVEFSGGRIKERS